MKKKMLFIYNPRAGKSQIRSNLLDMIDIFVKAGYEVTAYPTQAQGDGIRAVTERQIGYYDMIACSGGDGTLDEVVTGMMRCEKDCRSATFRQEQLMTLPEVWESRGVWKRQQE